MRTTAAILAGLFLATGLAQAQPKLPPQPSMPPLLKIVSGADKTKGRIFFTEVAARLVPVTREIVENVNGVAVKKTVTEYVTENVKYEVIIAVGSSRIITPDGKLAADEAIWKQVKKGSAVVVSVDGNTPAAPFLRALHQETIIIIPPAPKVVPPVPVPPKS